MGDVLRAEDVETCKENIQPLREGRRASTLKKIVSATKSVEDIEKERQSFEIRIQNYVGNDPFELWIAYLSWSKETFPSNLQSEFLPLAERCIQIFWSQTPLNQEGRFLRILLQYSEMVSNPLEIYAGMEQNGIGVGSAAFWKARGRAYEAREDWPNAEVTYQKGVDLLAKPIEMMKSIQTEFEARMFRRIKAEMAAAQSGVSGVAMSGSASSLASASSSRAIDTENRAPLGALARATANREYESGTRGLPANARPGDRTGDRTASSNGVNGKKRGSDQLEIFVDDEFATEDEKRGRKHGDAPFSAAPIIAAGLALESKKENERATEKWIDNKMPQDASALAAVRRMERGIVAPHVSGPLHVFEDPSLPQNNEGNMHTAISKPTALKMRDGARIHRGIAGSNGPYRFTIQSEFYPQGSNEPTITSNGSKEKSAYDRTMVYPGDGKEYSFEEIRARVYAARTAAALASTSQTNTNTIEGTSNAMDVTIETQSDAQEPQQISTVEFTTSEADFVPLNTSTTEKNAQNTPSMGVEQSTQVEITETKQTSDSEALSAPSAPVELVSTLIQTNDITSEESNHQTSIQEPETQSSSNSPLIAIEAPLIPSLPTSNDLMHPSFEDQLPLTPMKFTKPDEPILTVFDESAALEDLNASMRSLVDDFEKVSGESKPGTPLREVNPMQSTSEAVCEPLIASTAQPFVIFEDQDSQDGVDIAKLELVHEDSSETALEGAAPSRRALAPLSALTTLSMTSGASSRRGSRSVVDQMQVDGMDAVNDENDPAFVAKPKPSSPLRAESTVMPTVAVLSEVEKPKKPLAARNSIREISTSELIETEAAAVQLAEESSWRYDPESHLTMSGVTRRTKDAMDEVMGMFQFEKTMTSIIAPTTYNDGDGGFDVTASIVIPLDSVNKALMGRNSDFAIFEDNLDMAPSMPTIASVPAPSLIFEPFQDENILTAAPSTAIRALQPLAPQIMTYTAPMAFSAPIAPAFEVFDDMAMQESVTETNETALEVEREPSQMTVFLSRAALDDDHASGQHTSTLNFTMSGMTTMGLNSDTMTLNTQKLGNLVARSTNQKRGQKPSYYALPLQNPSLDSTTGLVRAYADARMESSVHRLFDWNLASQAAQWSALKDAGIEGAVNALEASAPQISSSIGETVLFGEDEYVVTSLLSQNDADHDVYLLESESGQEMVAQRGNLYDYWISKRVFTKLGSHASTPGLLSEEVVEELYATLVDYTRAYVFQDGTWLMWPLKSTSKGSSPDASALMKLYHTTLSTVIAQRDAKGYEEIVIWYFVQRLLKLVHALHSLGFAMGGALSASDFGVSATCIDFSAPSSNLGSRGFILRNYAALIDVESYTAGTQFAHQQRAVNAPTSEIIDLLFGASQSWLMEPDWVATTAIAHQLLHGKEMLVEPAANSKFKPKLAPKIFWNASLWNLVFETALNPTLPSATPIQSVLAQVDTHIATKGAPLRFQISKLQF